MAGSAAAVWVDVLPSLRGFSAQLRKETGAAATTAGGTSGKAFGSRFSAAAMGPVKQLGAVAAGAFAGAKVLDFFKDAVGGASDLAETTSKIGQIFGSSAGDIQAFAANAATALGQTRQQALDANATFGIFGKSAGLSGGALTGFTTQLTSLATDMASFNNTSPEQAIEAIGSALRGESEPIRAYGVLLDDASLRQQALAMGITQTTKQALTPQQRVLAAQQLIMKQTSVQQGDFQRTSSGLANQQRILAARFADFKTQLGTAFLPVATQVFSFLAGPGMAALRSVIGVFGAIRGVITNNATLFKTLAAVVLAGAGVWATYNAVIVIQTALATVQKNIAIAQFLWTNRVSMATRAQAAAQAVLNAVMALNPVALVVTALVALGVALFVAYKKSETFRNVVQGAWNGIKAAAAAWAFLQPVFQGIASAGEWLWNTILKPVFTAWMANLRLVASVFLWLWNNAVKPTLDFIGAAINVLWGSFIKPILNIWISELRSVGSVFTWLWNNAIHPAINFIGAAIQVLWGSFIKPVFNILMSGLRAVGAVFSWLWNHAVSPAFNGIRDVIRTVWENGVRPAFDAVKKGVRAVADGFRIAKDAIGRAWDEVKEKAAGPVRFVIDTVYTNGIKKVWDAISTKFGGDPLPRVPSFARGGLADRGLALVGEQGPELVNFREPGRVYTAAQTKTMFGNGMGGIGDILGDITDVVRSAGSAIARGAGVAADALFAPVRKLIGQIGDSGYGQLLRRMMTSGLEKVISGFQVPGVGDIGAAISQIAGGALGGVFFPLPAGSYAVGVGLGHHTGPHAGHAHTGQDFPAPTGTPVFSPFAGNFVPRALGNRSYGNMANVFSPSGIQFIGGHLSAFARGSGPVRGGEVIGFVGSTGHSTGPHLHAEFRRNGQILDPHSVLRYDSGGMLPPGLNLTYNGTGAPEPILTGRQWDTLHAAAQSAPQVRVFIGDRELTDIVRTEVDIRDTALADSFAYRRA